MPTVRREFIDRWWSSLGARTPVNFGRGPAFILALQQAQTGQGTERFDTLLYGRLDATLGEYLNALQPVH